MSRRKKRLPEGEFTGVIDRFDHQGRGIAIVDGKTTFIDFALPGETVTFKYTNTRARYDEAKVLEIQSPSHDRTDPFCEAFGRCGGCAMQHMHSDYQLALKQQVLSEQFQHFGHLKPQAWLEPLQSPQMVGYRKKARLGVRYVAKKGKVLVGFREIDGRFLADIDHCPVLDPSIGDKLDELQSLIYQLDCYASLPQIEVAVDDDKTALIIRHLEPLSASDLHQIKQFALDHQFWIYLQPKGPDTVYLLYPDLPEQEQYLVYHLPDYGLEMRFQPTDFTQVNAGLNQLMIHQAIDLMAIKKTDQVLDLFCGLGNFSLPMASFAQSVTGVEGEQKMVERAGSNAQINQLENTSFYRSNLFESIDDADWANKTYDKILLDPPRAGAEAICQSVERFQAKRIVYISCNPATLARDAGILVHQQGYHLSVAGVMDMFPHTAHVESIAVFDKYCIKSI